ncbi:ATP-binding cassette domain-containing protein [Conexibacter sp. CPCC 206217]|uniref:ATP-binding cassette domain-containing protein n=1 Tax=Conexibacter sp. CPCC 206217 TaxID=3064574 RepID=UPI0027279D8A|nr:ATP-binding cassette domain-containing protein [Conexibacter sp. CPCC 206217]MDO8209655.1 ATP-binding cassette domain-containing protein [Conexibacter sp. CPCC 206217]
MLRFEGVTKRYLRFPREIVALDRISLEIAAGDRFGVLGSARAGKSTLLRLAAGLERPDEGSVWFRDRDLATVSRSEQEHLLRHEIGCVWQTASAGSRIDIVQYVAWPLFSAGVRYRRAIRQAHELLARVGAQACAGAQLCELAASELTRVSLAQALIREPSLLLADEPSKTLDPIERDEMLELLRSTVCDKRITLVVTAGDATGIVAPTQLASLDRGRLVVRARRGGQVVPIQGQRRRPSTG